MTPAKRRQHRVQGGLKHKHSVRLTDEQQADLLAKAEAHGVTPSRYLADTATAARPVSTQSMTIELIGIRGQLGRIGGLVNQIAAAANRGAAIDVGALHDLLGEFTAQSDRWAVVSDQLDRLGR